MSSVLVSKIKLNGQIYEIIDRQSEAAIEALTARVDALGNGTTGGVAVETDPIYSADKSNIVFKSDISSLNIALKSDLSTYALKSEIPTKLSDLTQDIQVGGITEETDPTVPAWAKASTKPTYTWTEIQGKPTLFDGDYNKLINKPTIPSLDGLVTQGQLDAIIARLEALEAKPVVDGDILDFGGGGSN